MPHSAIMSAIAACPQSFFFKEGRSDSSRRLATRFPTSGNDDYEILAVNSLVKEVISEILLWNLHFSQEKPAFPPCKKINELVEGLDILCYNE